MHYIVKNGHLKVVHKPEVEKSKPEGLFAQAGLMKAVYSLRRDGGFNMEVLNENHI